MTATSSQPDDFHRFLVPRTDDSWIACVVVRNDESGVWFEGVGTDHYMGITPKEGHPVYRLQEGDAVLVEVDEDGYPSAVALWRA